MEMEWEGKGGGNCSFLDEGFLGIEGEGGGGIGGIVRSGSGFLGDGRGVIARSASGLSGMKREVGGGAVVRRSFPRPVPVHH